MTSLNGPTEPSLHIFTWPVLLLGSPAESLSARGVQRRNKKHFSPFFLGGRRPFVRLSKENRESIIVNLVATARKRIHDLGVIGHFAIAWPATMARSAGETPSPMSFARSGGGRWHIGRRRA